MAVDLIVAPEAENDLAQAYAWYEGQRTGLGEEFLSCADACIKGVCRMPEMYSVVHKAHRRALLRRFPYAVYYKLDGDTVTVYCIFHTAREPEEWQRRLP